MAPIAFIVYHTAISSEGIEAIARIYPEEKGVNWRRRWKKFQDDYLPYVNLYIETLFKSARLFHPNCRCIVLSDQDTSFTFSEEFEIKRYALNPDKPAYNRMLAQKRYLTESDDQHSKIFLDYDMLIQTNLEELTAADFDVALTYDPTIERVNGSFIMVQKGKKAQGIHYFRKIEELYLNSYSTYEAWGGIAVSMNDLLALNLREISYLQAIKIDDLTIFILPSDPYNYPVSTKELTFFEFLPDKKILHFKGVRKKSMLEYWNSYLKPRV